MKFKNTKDKMYRKDEFIITFSFCSTYIDAIGYDAQRALLEVRMAGNGRIRRYADVPEEIWYRFRESASPDIYYRRCICGHFREMKSGNLVGSKSKMPLDKHCNISYHDNENDYQNIDNAVGRK